MGVLRLFRAEGATRNDWYLDAAVATMGLVLLHVSFTATIILLVTSISTGSIVVASLMGGLAFASIIIRRHYPDLFFAAVVICILGQLPILDFPTVSWLIMFVGVFDTARWMPARHSRICLAVAIIVLSLGALTWVRVFVLPLSALDTVIVFGVISGIGAAITAYSIGRRGYDVGEARARQLAAEFNAAQMRITEQATYQRSLEIQVRTDISRELHDIVAHSVAVMVVQAEGGLAQIGRSPQTARQALTTISETGREALQEMRHIVSMLRAGGETRAEDLVSTPRWADVPALIEKTHAHLMVVGTPQGVTQGVEVTIYRVIQEAITNSLKHAGPNAAPRVKVDWEDDLVTVTIKNRSTHYVSNSDSPGMGLLGMSERVQGLGGTLLAGKDESGGFTVCARIPLEAAGEPRNQIGGSL